MEQSGDVALCFWGMVPSKRALGKQTDLCEQRFVDTVNIRFGLLFNFVSKCFVADCTVYQRLHERTQTKQHTDKLEQALALRSHISEFSNAARNRTNLLCRF